MIDYEKHTLSNGLTVIAHRDKATPMAAVNIIYKVGSKNENPSRTGFAHLFEHLMFGGSVNIPDFDMPLQIACGENNAFTNTDYTDYYITLPKDNIETALWLESDRMLSLSFNRKSLEVQRKVVMEEFNQRYINQPYGDLWMLMRSLVYKVHPYRWATIGITPDHLRDATMDDVKAFYAKYYNPDNAILAVAADMEAEKVFALAEKWFGDIIKRTTAKDEIPAEPQQAEARRLEVRRDVPASVIVTAFHMPARTSPGYYTCDVISDILSNGNSSRMYRNLVKGNGLFSSVNAYVTGESDPGLFVVTGHLLPGTTPEVAEAALWEELDNLKKELVPVYERDKVQNKYESETVFGELNVMNKALNLCYYEMLGDITLINREVELHRAVTREHIRNYSVKFFTPQRSSTLLYLKNDE